MVTPTGYTPQRGDLVWMTFNPPTEHGQADRRPALVLSHGSYNGLVGLAAFCPITGQSTGYPFEVPLPDGLPIRSVILVDQIKSLAWRVRQVEYIGSLPNELLQGVMARLAALIAAPSSEAFFR